LGATPKNNPLRGASVTTLSLSKKGAPVSHPPPSHPHQSVRGALVYEGTCVECGDAITADDEGIVCACCNTTRHFDSRCFGGATDDEKKAAYHVARAFVTGASKGVLTTNWKWFDELPNTLAASAAAGGGGGGAAASCGRGALAAPTKKDQRRFLWATPHTRPPLNDGGESVTFEVRVRGFGRGVRPPWRSRPAVTDSSLPVCLTIPPPLTRPTQTRSMPRSWMRDLWVRI
jgi:hypothetical protein